MFTRSVLLLFAAAPIACAAAQAAPEDAFFQAAFGLIGLEKGSVCFARDCDDRQLAAHKGQRIRDVAIHLSRFPI